MPSVLPREPELLVPPTPAAQPEYRRFGDNTATRKLLFNNVLKTAQSFEPLTNQRHTLTLSDVRYNGPESFSIAEQKKAILNRGTIGRELRGTWALTDNETGEVIAQRKSRLGSVPYITDRGTFISRGNEFTMANQMRLRPGAFARVKANGELETHVNFLPGKGRTHRIFLDPKTGVFKMNIAQANIPLITVLRAMGVNDKRLRDVWGNDLAAVNMGKQDPRAIGKLYEHLHRGEQSDDEQTRREQLSEALRIMELDPETTSRTLGRAHTNLTEDAILDITAKLLRVNNGEEGPDDRDALEFQRFVGPEDVFPERIKKARSALRLVLWKATAKGNLDNMKPGVFDDAFNAALMSSGLGQCFDDETSVLTRRGFIPWSDASENDEFACMVDGQLQYHRAYHLYAYDYDGEMIRCRTKRFSYLVTPHHRLWCKAKVTGEYRVEIADHAYGHQRIFYTGLPSCVGCDTDFILPSVVKDRWRNETGELILPGDLWAEFLGWYLAEGWVSDELSRQGSGGRRLRVCLSQSRTANPGHWESIAAVLNALPFNWKYNSANSTFYVTSKQLATELLKYGDCAATKRIPRYCFEWSVRRLRLLASTFIRGDGNEYAGYVKTETTSPGLADDIVELTGRTGGTGRTSFRPLSKKNTAWNDSYVTSVSCGTTSFVRSSSAAVTTCTPDPYSREHYIGTVYCASVPGERLYVMRDGKPHWSSNSLEEINPAEVFDQSARVTRMGEGGITSMDAVPDDTRAVQPSQFGFIDSLRTPESEKVGVDLRLARGARKGNDGQIYTSVQRPDGEQKWVTPQDLSQATLAFPGELRRNREMVAALQNGKVKMVPRATVDYSMPHMEDTFSPLSNMIPMKSMVKGQRAVMAARMLTQALPLIDGQSPMVQGGMPDQEDRSFEEEYADKMGALRAEQPGRVTEINPNGITVQYANGSEQTHELYENFPFNRKTFIHQTPTVQVGQVVQPGDLMARSNFTDDAGVTALGTNARVAYMSFRGLNFEDANVISESMAERLSSEHMYQHQQDFSDEHRTGKNSFIAMFPAEFNRKTLDNFDDDGIIRRGTEVKKGDPLILTTRKRPQTRAQVHRGRKPTFINDTITWDHDKPGVVTDITFGPKGASVVVKSVNPMEVGDKLSGRYGDKGVISAIIPDDQMPRDDTGRPYEVLLNPLGVISRCYDWQTEFLTENGWKLGEHVLPDDRLATYNTGNGHLHFRPQTQKMHVADYSGDLLYCRASHMDFAVTPNHTMWARSDYPGSKYQKTTAERIYKHCWWVPTVGDIVPGCKMQFKLPHLTYSIKDTQSNKEEIAIRAEEFAEFLGWFLSEGHTVYDEKSREYKVFISQDQSANVAKCEQIADLLDRLPFSWFYKDGTQQFVITGKRLAHYCKQFGLCYEKYVPRWLFQQPVEIRQLFLDALWAGDGRDGVSNTGTFKTIALTSEQLIDDVQQLLIMQGVSAIKRPVKVRDGDRPMWRCAVMLKKRDRMVCKAHWSREPYYGKIYCPTVATGFVLTRRNGKILIAGNTNPAQIVETALGKIVERTGKPYKMKDFEDIDDAVEYAIEELRKHGLNDLSDIVDPDTDRRIPEVLTGNRWFMKLHHTAEGKAQGRGTGAYTAEGTPAKGGETGAKRIGMLELNSLLSHGATEVVRDASLVRGQASPEYWSQFMSGFKPPTPKIPFVYEKFVSQLKSSGINVVRDGGQVHIMAMRDQDIDELAGDREIRNADTVDWRAGLKPKKGGLFDQELTGGHNGRRWSFIRLHEPLPNPVMEEPIRRILGLTKTRMDNIISGKEQFGRGTGPKAIAEALDAIDLKKELAQAREDIKSGKRTARDAAVRKLGYLKSAERLDIHPREWVITKAPVLPPAFRSVSVMGPKKLPMVADPNFLYKELFDANKSLRDMSEQLGDDVGEERLATYRALKGVTGLGDPIHPRNQERRVKGILKHVFGNSPKMGVVQRRLLGSSVDLVGRSVITPNPDLDMDHVGIPESKAWEIYKPFIVRGLVRNGMSRLQAARSVKERSKDAREALVKEMDRRPVIINRAPTLHRYGVMASWPKLVKGDTLQVSPLVVGGFNADFDGDAMNYHVPSTDEAADEAAEKMLPSRNLFSASNFKVHYKPSQEYVGGLYEASARQDDKNKAAVFDKPADAIRAYKQGKINVDRRVVILNP